MWEMATTCPQDEDLLDSEERHERTPHRASAHLDSVVSLVPSVERDGKKRIVFGWDAADGRNGGAERTASEALFKMARFDHRTGALDQGAITPVPDLVLAFERVSLPVVWAWATFFNVPKKILRLFCA